MNDPVLWLDGRFLRASEAAVSPLDRGFLSGDGLFETLRAESGRIPDLAGHLARLGASAQALGLTLPPDLERAEDIFRGLMRDNGLLSGPARLKAVLTRGAEPGPGLPRPMRPTLLLTAAAYVPPTEAAYAQGVRLGLSRRATVPAALARHKTLSRLPYLAARQEALDHGADEAVLLDPQGGAAETDSGALLVHDGRSFLTTPPDHRLPSRTLDRLAGLLAAEGRPVAVRGISPGDLASARTVWVLSALRLIMPVAEVDGAILPDRMADEAARLRTLLLRG